MTARLLCKFGEMKGAEFDIDAEATIGRSQQSTVVLPSDSVSGEHARIFWDEEAENYVLEDLNSLNGTKVDGIAVNGKQALRKLHVVNFGRKLEFIFVADARSSVEEAKQEPEKPAEPVEAAAGHQTQVDLEPPTLPKELLEIDGPEASESPKDAVASTQSGYEAVDLPEALEEPSSAQEPAPDSEENPDDER